MQDHPGAPGTARQESTHTIVSTYDGGNATQPRAPGHERPHAASSGAARHGRLSAASTAPGADIPRATSARAPGQYCQSAAQQAPGHGRPLATAAGVPDHDRLSAAPRAPGVDAPLAITTRALGHHCLSAAPIATASSPAGPRRLRQAILPRVPATPNTLTNPHAHQDTARTAYRRATRYAQSRPRPSVRRSVDSPSLPGKGPGVRSKPLPAHPTTHQVHPAIQVPPPPRSCSTADTGFPLRHHPRAPPRAHHSPSLQGGGQGVGPPIP